MKFMCLHGAIGNPTNFRVQLDPIIKPLESDGAASFVFIQGSHQVDPPDGFKEYFGPGPHYRFLNDGGLAEQALLQRIRKFPEGLSPEDSIRKLGVRDFKNNLPAVKSGIDGVRRMIDDEGGVQGLIGYSEGALIVAMLILEEERLFKETGKPRQIKCALFLCGWPPLAPDGSLILADESEEMIQVPSVHVIGATDPFLAGALALFNVCDEDTAVLFDHGKGHTIPRDAQTIKELCDTLKTAIAKGQDF